MQILKRAWSCFFVVWCFFFLVGTSSEAVQVHLDQVNKTVELPNEGKAKKMGHAWYYQNGSMAYGYAFAFRLYLPSSRSEAWYERVIYNLKEESFRTWGRDDLTFTRTDEGWRSGTGQDYKKVEDF